MLIDVCTKRRMQLLFIVISLKIMETIFASRTVLFIRVGNKKAKYFTVIQREPD